MSSPAGPVQSEPQQKWNQSNTVIQMGLKECDIGPAPFNGGQTGRGETRATAFLHSQGALQSRLAKAAIDLE